MEHRFWITLWASIELTLKLYTPGRSKRHTSKDVLVGSKDLLYEKFVLTGGMKNPCVLLKKPTKESANEIINPLFQISFCRQTSRLSGILKTNERPMYMLDLLVGTRLGFNMLRRKFVHLKDLFITLDRQHGDSEVGPGKRRVVGPWKKRAMPVFKAWMDCLDILI